MPDGAAIQSAHLGAEARRLVIWRFSDKKPGHDNQSLGIAEAMAEEIKCEIHSLTPIGPVMALLSFVTGRAFANEPYPDPDLILGAGHATHLSMLAARRSRGGRVIVLMTPSLPKKLFDLCLIPEHDRPGNGGNVIVTPGQAPRRQKDILGAYSPGRLLAALCF
jgi:mitochondrial fission protein ELM1